MDIGKKIKTIRIEKLMTQRELAGEMITRNMLSQIENGIAQPSLSTVAYLASRLGVPAGYLLSEGDDEFLYNKSRVMKNIKKAYLDKDYRICRDMCLSSFDEYDDELELILTDCCIGEAEELIKNGKLHFACEMLDEALRHSEKTIYSTAIQKKRMYLLFHLLKNISPVLDSNEIDTDVGKEFLIPSNFEDVFGRYVAVIFGEHEMYSDMFNQFAYTLSEYDKLYLAHIQARGCMSVKDFKSAARILGEIVDGETVPEKLLLYLCCCDLELCCKEIEDYKGAYEFSNNKMEILEYMLSEL